MLNSSNHNRLYYQHRLNNQPHNFKPYFSVTQVYPSAPFCIKISNVFYRISFFQNAKLAQFLYGRQNVDTFTLMYNIVLLIFYISFGIFSDESHTTGNSGCKVVAGINYWLLLW